MKKLILCVIAIFVVAIAYVFGQAAAAAEPAAVAAQTPGFFSWENLKTIMEYGAVVFLAIQGLKNIPFFADFFVAWPKLGTYVNAALAGCAAIILCLKMPGHDAAFYTCIATALGIFLSAAGIHLVVAKISPDNSSPAANPERVAKLENKKG